MLIPARVAVALRCPLCGKTDIRDLSLFALSGRTTVRLDCGCGHYQATLSRSRGRVRAQMPCPLCGGRHQISLALRQCWEGDLTPLACPATDLYLGVLGPPGAVYEFMSAGDGDAGAEPLGDFFVNPEVMYEVLAAVHGLEEEGRLRCRCGNTEIEYELQPDRVELICPRCGATRSLAAAHKEDADRARRARRLELGGSRHPERGRRG